MGVLINPCDNAVRVSLGLFRSVVLLCVGIDNRLGLGPLRLSISFLVNWTLDRYIRVWLSWLRLSVVVGELGLRPWRSGMAELVGT